MTEKQWTEVGAIADQEYVDFIRSDDDINGWSERVKELGYMTDEEAEKSGGWEKVFWEACEYV